MNVKKEIELGNQHPSPDEGKDHRLSLLGVQDDIDKIILETVAAKDTKLYTFYGIFEEQELRYIGITINTLEKRLKQHIGAAQCNNCKRQKSYRDRWITKCLNNNINISINELFKYNVDYNTAYRIETLLIDHYESENYRLTNVTRKNFVPSEKLKDKTHLFKSIILLTKDGEYIKEYDSILSLSQELGIHSSHITNVLKKRKKSAGGYLVVYKSEYDGNIDYKYERYLYDKSPMLDPILKQKIMAAQRIASCRPIKRIDKDGNFKIFECIADALRDIGVKPNHTSNVIKNIKGTRTHAFGYKWEYFSKI